MSLRDTIKSDFVKYADPILRAIELVQSITGIGGTTAETSLKAIDAIMHTLEQGVADQLAPEQILAGLDALQAGEAADDAAAAAANAAELAKYPPTSTGGA